MSDQGELALERIRAAAASGSKGLDLSGIGLTELPDELWELTQLTSLKLSRNQLTGVPEAISRLTNLTTLYLSGNQLTGVPEAIFGLTNLTHLDLRGNPLDIPQEILERYQKPKPSSGILPSLGAGRRALIRSGPSRCRSSITRP